MPNQDKIHNQVKRALIADGWTITGEQKKLFVQKKVIVYGIVDILAERAIAAERGGRKIAVEAKSFLSDSPTSDFTEAVGQYASYYR